MFQLNNNMTVFYLLLLLLLLFQVQLALSLQPPLKHLISVNDVTLSDIERIFSYADHYQTQLLERNVVADLKNKIMITYFEEASTRTFASFHAAMLRLGGQVIDIDVGKSSKMKGESFEDTIRTLCNYGDILVIRHSDANAIEIARKVTTKPIINAGNGGIEHPTQALLDLYTIEKELGSIAGSPDTDKVYTFLGDMKHSRTVHSLVKLLMQFSHISLNFISPLGLEFPSDLQHMKAPAQHFQYSPETKHHFKSELHKILAATDVLYVTRLQRERFATADERSAGFNFKVNKALLEQCKNKMIVMHPLPRLDELDEDVDADPRAAYFKQVENGLFIRMAVLQVLLNERKDFISDEL